MAILAVACDGRTDTDAGLTLGLRVLSATLFYPRGGSARVARVLARGLGDQNGQVTLVAGSRSGLGGHGDASRFYGEVQAVDFVGRARREELLPSEWLAAPGHAEQLAAAIARVRADAQAGAKALARVRALSAPEVVAPALATVYAQAAG